MHTLKASWVGQTFALAKPNESGGKKTRIRRSKEERKEMVESFIKKYQNLNSGDFPSLRLTHKEVGGSFYIVREIVREIIQENKVLGPSKLIPEEQSMDQHIQENPSGLDLMRPAIPLSLSSNEGYFVSDQQDGTEEKRTASFSTESRHQMLEDNQSINGSHLGVENEESDRIVSQRFKVSKPFEENGMLASSKSNEEQNRDHLVEQNHLKSTFNKNLLVPNQYQGTDEDLLSLPDSFSPQPGKQRLESGKNINGNYTEVENGELMKTACMESQLSGHFQEKKTMEDMEVIVVDSCNSTENVIGKKAMLTDMSANVVVETFPLRHVTTVADSMDRPASKLKSSSEILKGNEIEGTDLGPDDGSLKLVDGVETSYTGSGLSDGKATEDAGDSLSDKISVLQEKKIAGTVADSTIKNSELQTALVSNGIELAESKNGTLTSETVRLHQPTTDSDTVSNGEASKLQEATMKEVKVDARDSSSHQKGCNTTLNRIKPESWTGTPNGAAGSETNPLVAIFKLFISAFVKFWTE